MVQRTQTSTGSELFRVTSMDWVNKAHSKQVRTTAL